MAAIQHGMYSASPFSCNDQSWHRGRTPKRHHALSLACAGAGSGASKFMDISTNFVDMSLKLRLQQEITTTPFGVRVACKMYQAFLEN